MKTITTSLFILLLTVAAHAATFTVTSTGDTKDLNAGNGICADAGGSCTLRAAVEESNASPASDGNTITFAVAEPSVITLTLSALIVNQDVTIVGPGARRLTVQRSLEAGTPRFRIFSVFRLTATSPPSVRVNISGITIANGENASGGGGISLGSDSILNLTEVVVRNNRAVDAPGGGIISNGTLNITCSLISNNTASQGAGLSNQPGSVTSITNSTITNNTAVGIPANNVIGAGGGITNFAQLALNNVTVSHNSATDFTGGISAGSTMVAIRNTMIAGNTAPNNRDLGGNVVSLGNNLIGDNSGSITAFPAGNPNANADRVGTLAAPLNPLLGPLQNNGGQTDTRALLTGSPAIDSGNNCITDNTCPASNPPFPLTADQRGNGFARRFGTAVDIGAFEQQPPNVTNSTRFDFDGDGKADVSAFRPENGVWYLLNSQAGFTGTQFGLGTDKLVPADFDGDRRTDIAVFRAGTWYLNRSQLGFTGVAFGDASDIPAPADFDGDGKSELVVWRPSNGTWYVYNLVSNRVTSQQFGTNEDKPVAGDYDGDGKADYAVFRPSNGTWYLFRSQIGFTGIQFGEAADKMVPADYDGDGKTDVAVFRPSNGTWYLLRSQLGFTGIAFGAGNDAPTPADYDGDGRTDVAVFRAADGVWYLNRSTAGFTGIAFGAANDLPVSNAFVR